MVRNATNKQLRKARKAKSDEFYTQLCDIERELQYYKDCFEGKTVYCNCDDPYSSNFFRYFVNNFHELRLKRVIAACYVPTERSLFQPSEQRRGFYCDFTGAGSMADIDVKSFRGDGDFRSDESVDLLKQSDVVVTNPPFSLFREFVAQLVQYDKQFLIIGNVNAITYKEIFYLIQRDKAWLGVNLVGASLALSSLSTMSFTVPRPGSTTRASVLSPRMVACGLPTWRIRSAMKTLTSRKSIRTMRTDTPSMIIARVLTLTGHMIFPRITEV